MHRRLSHHHTDEERLTADVIASTQQFGLYGYSTNIGLRCEAAWELNVSHVVRIWRHKGLRVPAKQPKRLRLLAH